GQANARGIRRLARQQAVGQHESLPTSSRSAPELSQRGTLMTTPLSYVTDGREAIGFVIARGRAGFESFDRQERSLGLFETAAKAANAVFDAAANEEGAG